MLAFLPCTLFIKISKGTLWTAGDSVPWAGKRRRKQFLKSSLPSILKNKLDHKLEAPPA